VITGGSPSPVVFSWDITLDETPNNPDDNPSNFCPYPLSSFYSAEYLAFNGGFNDTTDYPPPAPFGSLFDHPNVSGDPPIAERDEEQWLCGDAIGAALTGGTEQIVIVGGTPYTLELVGVTYRLDASPLSTDALTVDVDCGDPPAPGTLDVALQTMELNDTPGCIWAQFVAPTAITISEPVSASAGPASAGGVLLAAALLGLMLAWLVLGRRKES
jgi:hypothetical protein